MRLRFVFAPTAAGQAWPGPGDQQITVPFNWVKIDNRGAGGVAVGFNNALVNQAGLSDYYLTVSAGKVRVFNVGGPKNGEDSDNWPNKLVVKAVAATTVLIEIADHPIVDLISTI
jgi:hypothetical protein